jgi:hypothetical protein
MTKTYPFEIKPNQFFTLEVSQEDASELNNGTPIETEAIKLILQYWDETKPFGLQINQRFGFTPIERKNQAFADALAMQKSDQENAMALVVRIAEDTNQTVKVVTQNMEAIGQTNIIEPWIYPYLADATEIMQDQANTGAIFDRIQSTILIQRVVSDWTEELTDALTPNIRARLSEIAAIEWQGKKPPIDDKDPKPSEDSSDSSKTSKTTKSLTTTQ